VRVDARVALGLIIACIAGGCGSVARYDQDPGLPQFRAIDHGVDPTDGAFEVAMALVAKCRYADAAERLSQIAEAPEVARHPDVASKTLFWLGYCREKQGRSAEAAALYRRVGQDYPDTPAAAPAAERLSILTSPPRSSSFSF